jgi:hypothetical protein
MAALQTDTAQYVSRALLCACRLLTNALRAPDVAQSRGAGLVLAIEDERPMREMFRRTLYLRGLRCWWRREDGKDSFSCEGSRRYER